MGLPDTTSVNYQQIEKERLSEMQRTITETLERAKDAVGFASGLRQAVLTDVVAGNYEKARSRIQLYNDDREQFKNFQSRSQRLRKHAEDLIIAIETKRNFQGLGGLPLAKQQELYEKVLEHFEELKVCIKNIERMDKEIRLDDIRSTSWVLKTVVNSSFFIFVLAFLLDVQNRLAPSFNTVFEAFVNEITNSVLTFIGW